MALLATSFVAADDRPNIVLVMVDDFGRELLSTYGGTSYETPHLDQLSADGMTFDICYATPLCSPTRNRLLSGKYNFRNYTHFGSLNPNQKTFGQMLQAAGYKTAVAGKWQLNGLYNSLPGSDDRFRPQQAGFDEWLLWQVTKGKSIKDGGGERFWSPPLEHSGQLQTIAENENKYGPDLMCDFVCDFMKRSGDEPFFVYYPMLLVHDPFVPTPETIGDAPRNHGSNKAPLDKQARKENFVAMVNYADSMSDELWLK